MFPPINKYFSNMPMIITVYKKVSIVSSEPKHRRQLASLALRIPLLTNTSLLLILPKMVIQQQISILERTNPFHMPLKELHRLIWLEGDSKPQVDFT
jgi:hypothetical protein